MSPLKTSPDAVDSVPASDGRAVVNSHRRSPVAGSIARSAPYAGSPPRRIAAGFVPLTLDEFLLAVEVRAARVASGDEEQARDSD